MATAIENTAKNNGIVQKQQKQAVKRYCQTLELVDDMDLIKEYVRAHNEESHWKEIREGLREVGILEMEMYLQGNRVFMIVETGLDFDWDTAFSKLETLPRQTEWENKMSLFQRTKGAKSTDKWLMMQRIFHLYDVESQ